MIDKPHVPFFTVILAVVAVNVSAQDESLFAPAAQPTLALESGAGEGPAWHPNHGLFFSGRDGITLIDKDGKTRLFFPNAGSNGLLFDHQGRLLICQPARRRVIRMNVDNKAIEVLTDNFQGKRYNQPNDITVDSQGRIYFSDPRYGTRDGMELVDADGQEIEGVYRIDLNGNVTRIITHEVDRPNGLVVSDDDKYLYVADNNNNNQGGARKLWRFELQPDGNVNIASQTLLLDWNTGRGPDGMVLDTKGRLYVAGGLNKPNSPFETADKFKGGVYVLSPDGKLLDFVPIPRDEVTNCTFGGTDLRTLYVTAGGTLWSIQATNAGKMPFPK